MLGMMKKSSQWWWFDNQKKGNKGSPWLNSTLSELNEKMTTMLNLIDQDADSFTQRAEMYYQKRPELMNMVGDFYRSYRLLAERYDQIESKPITQLVTSTGSPVFCEKPRPEKAMSIGEKSCDSCSDITEFNNSETGQSEVYDPDEEEVVAGVEDEEGYVVEEKQELKKLREEMERLKAAHEEQLLQKDKEIQQMKKKLESAHKEKLKQKDEEKREVIRQLTYAMGSLKEENLSLKQHFPLAEEPHKNKKSQKKFLEKAKTAPKIGFLNKLFNGSLLSFKASLVAI